MSFYDDRTILVTGGGGSLGVSLARELLKQRKLRTVRLLDSSEYFLFETLRELKDPRLRFLLGDIRDRDRVSMAMTGVDYVIHTAAVKSIDIAHYNPIEAIEVNLTGTIHLIRECIRAKPKKFLFISCYDSNTRAVTAGGIRKFDELKEGELVFTLNPKTGEIETKPIEAIAATNYEGEMISFRGRSIDLLVTPNHRVLTLNSSKHNRCRFESASSLLRRKFCFELPKGRWKGRNSEWFELPKVEAVKRHPPMNCPDRVRTDDLLYILGIYIGDGFRNGWKPPKERYGGIFLDVPERDKARPKILATLQRMSIKYHLYSGRAGQHVFFSSRKLAKLFDDCGHFAHEKRIPPWALTFSPRHLQHLLDGLLDSDGHRGRGRRVYHTVSAQLVRDLIELGIKLGILVSFNKRKTVAIFPFHRKVQSTSYWVTFPKAKRRRVLHRNTTVQPYVGKIWCLTVKGNGNFLVERNGKVAFCGNSDKAVPRETSNVYAATKFIGERLMSWANTIMDDTRFASIRMGNFTESRMNVFDIWHKQAARGEPLTVTHPDAKRLFLSIQDAAKYVLEALEAMRGGETLVAPAEEKRILDLVGDRPYKLVGLREGERLEEILMSEKEKNQAFKKGNLWVISP